VSDLGLDRADNAMPPVEPDAPARLSAAARRVIDNTLAIGVSTIAAKGLMFLWQILLARALGARGYGIYGTIGALLAIGAAIPDLGMGLIVIREVARQPEAAGRYLGATLSLQPLLAAAGYAALLLGARLLGYDLEIRLLLAFAAVSLLVDVLGNMCHNQLVAAEQMAAPAVISVAHIVLLMTLGGAALLANGGLWGLYVAALIAGVGRTSAYWIVLRRAGRRPVFPADRAVMRRLLVDGLPLALAAFLSLAGTHADKLLTTALLGVERTGQLTAAFVIVFGVTELLSTPMLVAALPFLSRAESEGQSRLLQVVVGKLTFFNLLMSLPLAVTVSMLAIPLSRGLFGEGYAGAAGVLRLLIWYVVVAMAASVFAQVLTVRNRQGRLVAARTVGLSTNVALSLALIPSLGVTGVALAALLAEAVVLAQFLISVRFPAGWWAGIAGPVGRLGAATLVLAAWILGLRGIHPLLAALTALPAYIVLIRLFRALVPEDRLLVSQLLISMPGAAAVVRLWAWMAA
jgi:O-antigen/teichoic acid export membrane protein